MKRLPRLPNGTGPSLLPIVGLLVVAGVLVGGALPTAAQSSEMAFPGTSWAERSPKSQGVDAESLQAALRHLEGFSGEDGVRETVVIRNGYVIYRGDRADTSHGTWSVSKSIASTALGLLVEDGKAALDARASTVEPILEGRYADVTLRHFATMTSGYNADGPNRWGEPSADWSVTPYDVSAPLFEPGTAFAYWDEAMIVFGRVLTRLAGEELYDLVDRRIMAPIGVRDWSWWAEDSLDGTAVNYGATGVALSPLDLARFGHLFLNEGNWAGEQLLDSAWVRQAMRAQVPASLALADTDRQDLDGRGLYGFNWWTNGVNAGGERSMPDAPPGLYYASGFNNNMCFVIPEWDMVVVRMGEDGNPPEGKIPAYNGFFRELAKAVRRSPRE